MPLVTYSSKILSPEESNFCLPLPEVLETEKVKLIPFDPIKHLQEVWEKTNDNEILQYLPFGPYQSAQEFLDTVYYGRFHPDKRSTLFVVYDKLVTGETGPMAGLFGFIDTSEMDMSTEIGPAIVFKEFQGTHVATHATGILLHYMLDLPKDGGLGFRRVAWACNALNVPSNNIAEKMGFKKVGVIPWHRTLGSTKAGDNGRRVREGDPRADLRGRDSAIYTQGWDDWEDRGRELVTRRMEKYLSGP